MIIVNLGILVILPLFLLLFVTLPSIIYPRWPKVFLRFLFRIWKFIRMRILFCCKYYDPDLWEIDRKTLMLFAMARGKSKAVIKSRLVKSVYDFMR